jgi:hypothetical protein
MRLAVPLFLRRGWERVEAALGVGLSVSVWVWVGARACGWVGMERVCRGGEGVGGGAQDDVAAVPTSDRRDLHDSSPLQTYTRVRGERERERERE